MSKSIEEILAPKPKNRLRIYAYSIDDQAHKGLLKVGQTTRDVKQRVAEQLKTAAIKNYKIELDEPIKVLGVYTIPVKLHSSVYANVKVWVVRD